MSDDHVNNRLDLAQLRNRVIVIWVVCLLVLTAGLLLWYRVGMNRVLLLNGHSQHPMLTLSDSKIGGTSHATLTKKDGALVLHCHLADDYQWPYCGFGIRFVGGKNGVDLARFDTVDLDIHTLGAADIPVKVYLLNYDPVYSKDGDPTSYKINELQYFPNDRDHSRVVPLHNLHVSPWWLRAHDIEPEHAGTDLHHIRAVQVFTGDVKKMGDYTVIVRAIAFHGKWVSPFQLLAIILALWVLSALVLVVSTLIGARRQVRYVRQQNQQLEGINDALKLEAQHLEAVATHDELTGLSNRVGLRNRLFELVPHNRHRGRRVSAIYIDIDHFKNINDEYGHGIGDEVLQQFAKLIGKRLRATDFFCRWGGEEFIILCTQVDINNASGLADALRELIATSEWPAGTVTASFGVAQLKDGETVSSLLDRADKALYDAKQRGRNCVSVAH